MSSDIPLLSNVQVAAPCAAVWNDMQAIDGDRVHFCAGCKKNVYNLSAMTQNQAEGLLRKHEGHLCVRYYKRTDGTILTQNCPVGQAALRMKMIARSKRAALATAVFVSMVAFAYSRLVSQRNAIMGDSASPPSVFQQFKTEFEDAYQTMGSPAVEHLPVRERDASRYPHLPTSIEPNAKINANALPDLARAQGSDQSGGGVTGSIYIDFDGSRASHYEAEPITEQAKSLGIRVPGHIPLESE